uniref:TTF-type domain-containing protein n=1 Tax=Myripristis murdjan TaxID=586833 RepID=A0A667Y2X2_9TELE
MERSPKAGVCLCPKPVSTMAKQCSLLRFFKKPRVEEEDVAPPRASESTLPHSSDSCYDNSDKANASIATVAGCDQPVASSPEQHDSLGCAPVDLSAIDEPPSQPNLRLFPCTVKNGKSRSFSSKWYAQFSWLEYSVAKDAIFCKICRHFPNGADGGGPFAKQGFTDWKHLSQSCQKHQASRTHSVSLDMYESYRASQSSGRGNVINQMNRDAMSFSFIERNRDHLKVVLDIVLFCAKQDIPLRGHRETTDALNKGNFIELFNFMCKYDPQIKSRLEQLPRNGTLMSPDIQNDLLESAASLLLRKIKAEIGETPGTYYALMADEYKDDSKRELVAVCVRYVHAGTIKERAIGFVETSDMSASGISEKILQVIEPLQLDPSLCVGFSFDGVSVVSGSKGGVHVILKQTFPDAVYVHCNSHRLNLVLCAASKASGHVSTFFDTVNSIHSFMTGSSRHARFLELQKELHPDRPTLELERSTEMRWSSKSGSLSKVLTLLDVILETLSECAEGSGQTKVEAQSLLQQIQTKKFIFLLVTFGKLFHTSDFATRGLQSPTLSVADCIDLIEGLKQSFARFRDNSECDFEKVIKLTDELMQKNEITSWDVTAGSRARRLPTKLAESVVTTSLGKSKCVKSNDDLRHIWNHILDRQLTELHTRFQEDQYGIMRAAAAFLPPSRTFAQRESLQAACNHFHVSVGDAELTVFFEQMRRKGANGVEFASLVEVMDICAPDIFPNLNNLLRIIVTLPMTSCSVERLFSTSGRIKTHLRTSMCTGRLNNLALLSFENELCESLDYDEIISVFNRKPRRLRLVL